MDLVAPLSTVAQPVMATGHTMGATITMDTTMGVIMAMGATTMAMVEEMYIFINMNTIITMDQSGVPSMVITEEGITKEVQLAQ